VRLMGKDLGLLVRDVVVEKGRPCRFEAKGFSMGPFIRDGDYITVFPLPTGGPRVGDVVAALLDGERTVVHRLVGKRFGAWMLKGDCMGEKDGLVERAALLGVIRRVDRKGRKKRLGIGPERGLIAFLSARGFPFRRLDALFGGRRRREIAG
jgi:hypothetical protein